MTQFRRLEISLLLLLAHCAVASLRAQEMAEEPEEPRAVYPIYTENPVEGGEEGFFVEQASLLWQQPGGQPAGPSLSTSSPRSTRSARTAAVGLASVPNMFGDCGLTTANITVLGNGSTLNADFMLPVAGGSRTAKISENDISLPVDRIFFNYNHYQNIFMMQSQQAIPPGPLTKREEPIDRYTMGFEKTFFDQNTSVELRMPFTGSFTASLPGIAVDNGNFGNMAVIFKALLYRNENLGIGAGVGFDLPTGSDTVARLGGTNLRFMNESLHILPWIGFLYSPGDSQWGWGDSFFMTGFLQYDATASGNTVRFESPGGGGPFTSLGKFTEQDALYTDVAFGYWLHRNPDARLSGLAIVNEWHYTTSMQNTDLVAGADSNVGAVVSNIGNRFDVVNTTIALQFLLFDMSSLRIGGVFPIGSRDDQRFFDHEVQVQFNRRF